MPLKGSKIVCSCILWIKMFPYNFVQMVKVMIIGQYGGYHTVPNGLSCVFFLCPSSPFPSLLFALQTSWFHLLSHLPLPFCPRETDSKYSPTETKM